MTLKYTMAELHKINGFLIRVWGDIDESEYSIGDDLIAKLKSIQVNRNTGFIFDFSDLEATGCSIGTLGTKLIITTVYQVLSKQRVNSAIQFVTTYVDVLLSNKKKLPKETMKKVIRNKMRNTFFKRYRRMTEKNPDNAFIIFAIEGNQKLSKKVAIYKLNCLVRLTDNRTEALEILRDRR